MSTIIHKLSASGGREGGRGGEKGKREGYVGRASVY